MSHLYSFGAGGLVVAGFFALQAFVAQHEDALIEQSLSANVSAAIIQCLPEEVDEVCSIALVEDDKQLKLITERHSLRHYGQPPVKQPSLKFVIAMGDQK